TLCETHYQQACRLMRSSISDRAPDQVERAGSVAGDVSPPRKRTKLAAPLLSNGELTARDAARNARSSDGGAAGSGLTAEQKRMHVTDETGNA
ncbi:MAG: hypothetical protein ACPIOQ_39890, partial [Promethearchaeia archaeon]